MYAGCASRDRDRHRHSAKLMTVYARTDAAGPGRYKLLGIMLGKAN